MLDWNSKTHCMGPGYLPPVTVYCKNTEYWDRQALENIVDPDQMLQNAASDQGLQCLHQAICLTHQYVVEQTFINYRTSMVRS